MKIIPSKQRNQYRTEPMQARCLCCNEGIKDGNRIRDYYFYTILMGGFR